MVTISIKGGGLFGSSLDAKTEVFKPEGAGPFPVAIYTHGRSGTQRERSEMQAAIPLNYARYWLGKGFAVVAPHRPGYGKTGGADRENPGHSFSGPGACTRPEFSHTVRTSGAVTRAALEWVRAQGWANASAIVLTGNSVGGVSSVVVASDNPAGVIGVINFAGGIGGNTSVSPGQSCAPAMMEDIFAAAGKTAKLPSLWMYAENDLFWGPKTPRAWHAAFLAGGSDAQLVVTDPVPNQDGHELLFVGDALWTAHTDAYLKRLGY